MHTISSMPEKDARESTRRRPSLFASLRVRLMLLTLLALLPMLGLLIFNHSEQRQKAGIEAQESALRLAQAAASDQARLVEATRQLLVVLAQIPSVQKLDTASCNRFMADLLRQLPLYQNLAAATPDGNVYCSAVPYAAPTNVAGHDDFQAALRTKDFAVSDYRVSLITGRPSFSFAYPVVDESGTLFAAVSAILDLSWLDEFVAKAELPEGATLSVIDTVGTILTRYPEPETWRGQTVEMSVMRPLLADGEGVYEATGVDGIPRFYGFTRLCCVSEGNVYVRVGVSRDVAFSEANRTLRRNLIALGAVALLALALAGFGAQLFVLRPVNAILNALRKMDDGDLSVRVGKDFGGGTLGRLAQSFDRAAESLERREAELRRAHQALQIHTAQTEALARQSGRLGARLDVASVLSASCGGAASLLNVGAASISLWNETDGLLHHACDFGLPSGFGAKTRPLPRDAYEHHFGRGSLAVAMHTSTHPDLPDSPLYEALDIRKVVSAPMLRDGQLVGALNLYMVGKDRRFSEDEFNQLSAFAEQASLAITNARLYESLVREERARADLLRGMISAQEEERKRIARELHDETTQGISAVILGLDTVGMALAAGDAAASGHLMAAKAIAERTLEETRRLIGDLRPSLLDDLGLVPAIAWYGAQRLKPLGIAMDIQCDVDELRLPPSLEIALFRIAQEAITNIARHSGATRAMIRLGLVADRAILEVEDNGRGFVPEASVQSGQAGFGLQGIRERVSMLGGDFTLKTMPQHGTLLEVRVPAPMTGKEVANGEDTGTVG